MRPQRPDHVPDDVGWVIGANGKEQRRSTDAARIVRVGVGSGGEQEAHQISRPVIDRGVQGCPREVIVEMPEARGAAVLEQQPDEAFIIVRDCFKQGGVSKQADGRGVHVATREDGCLYRAQPLVTREAERVVKPVVMSVFDDTRLAAIRAHAGQF